MHMPDHLSYEQAAAIPEVRGVPDTIAMVIHFLPLPVVGKNLSEDFYGRCG